MRQILFRDREILLRKIHVIAAVIIIIVLVMTVSPGAGEQYRHQRTGILFPDTINTLKLVRATDYEPLYAGLGTGISYRTETMRADIFLYDLKQGPVPEGASSPVIAREFDQALSDILALEKQGTYKNISVIIKKETVPVGRLKFIHSVLTYEQNNIKLISHLYVKGCRGLFMKLRITYFTNARETEEINRAAFLSKIDDMTRDPSK
ncbi:MAG: hypothetical protein H6Q52_1497 [Deltaproteobacteria bacterium]|nr:hypothetical protein [Deltaproteobacteria bacterium]